MFGLFIHVLKKSLELDDNTTLSAIVINLMETIGVYACFLNPDVSNHIKNVLNAWEVFNISRVLLHFEYTDERLSTKVLEKLGGNFEIEFACDHGGSSNGILP